MVGAPVSVVLVTGAAGYIGSVLRPRLAGTGRTLRLLDIAPITAAAAEANEELIQASVTDMEALTQVCDGVDVIIHLAGQVGEAPWDRIAALNIDGTYCVFEAARRAGVSRVVFASSNHAVGFTPAATFPAADYAYPAPDSYYGVSKVTGEALSALYHYRYGLDTVCIRILTCRERPETIRHLSTWLSPDDAGRLFEAALTAPKPGFRVIYGVSRNTRGGWVSLDEARALGFEPQDDSERFAADVIARNGEPDPADPMLGYLGGEYCLPGWKADSVC